MKTHGMRHSKEYRAWASMKQRCTNSNDERWKNYGGRGISVCDEWMNSFPAFLRDMGEKPHPDYQLDRIDNDGNYCKENCQWVSKSVNQMNRRVTRRVTINGETKTLNEWSEETGLNWHTINSRIRRGITGNKLIEPLRSISEDTH